MKLQIPLLVFAAFFILSTLAFMSIFTLLIIGMAGSDAPAPFTKYVAVVPIKGELSTDAGVGSATSSEFVALIREADADPDAVAIVLDINSPGGGVIASKEVQLAVRAASKPVVAYIGDMGASGGYYVASAADQIVCDEDSLTASIGVVSLIPNYVGLMEKLGLNMTVLKEGEHKAMLNPYENLTAGDAALFQAIMHDAYSNFRRDVLINREGKITADQLDKVADGRIMNGRQALEAGLVDRLGSREDAIREAGQLGGIEGEPETREFSVTRFSFADIFMQSGKAFGQGLMAAGESSGHAELQA